MDSYKEVTYFRTLSEFIKSERVFNFNYIYNTNFSLCMKI